MPEWKPQEHIMKPTSYKSKEEQLHIHTHHPIKALRGSQICFHMFHRAILIADPAIYCYYVRPYVLKVHESSYNMYVCMYQVDINYCAHKPDFLMLDHIIKDILRNKT